MKAPGTASERSGKRGHEGRNRCGGFGLSGFFVWVNPARVQRIGAPTWRRRRACSLLAVFVVSVWACGIARADEVRRDTDGDGTVDCVLFLGHDRKVRRMKVDADGDGRFETSQFYDDGELSRLETDQNADGKPDAVYFYTAGQTSRVELDRNFDGVVDAAAVFAAGKRVREFLDDRGDGVFESHRMFIHPPWTCVVEVDEDADGRPDEWRSFAGDVLRRRIFRDPDSGRNIREESYDAEGRIYSVREVDSESGTFSSMWTYDATGEPVAYEGDTNGDGRPDRRAFWKGGRLIRMEEDRNRDGRVDTWIQVSPVEDSAVVQRDLDADGVPDIQGREALPATASASGTTDMIPEQNGGAP